MMVQRIKQIEHITLPSSKFFCYSRALDCSTPSSQLCNGSTDLVTVINKAGAFFKLNVPRSLKVLNVSFQFADSHAKNPKG